MILPPSGHHVTKPMTEVRRALRHESMIRRAVWSPLIALGCLVAFLLGLAFYFYDTARWVQHSSDILYTGSRSLRLAVDMESAKRGFFLSGDASYLRLYDDAVATFRREDPIGKLVALTADNSAQHAEAEAFRSEFTAWQKNTEKQLSRFRNASPSVIRAYPPDVSDKQQMEGVRAIQKRLIDEEIRLKSDRVFASDNVAQVALFGGSGLALLVGCFLALQTQRQMKDVAVQYETALEAEERVRERLATTLTSIGDGVIVTDSTGRITLTNPVTETLTGWDIADARGKGHREIFDITHEETGESVPSPIDQAILENRTVQLANYTVLKRRDGTRIAIEDSAAPIRDKNGNVSGAVLVFRDVTERKRQEAELALALEKNTRIAETLQRSMLVTPPKDAFPGILVTTLYESAWDEAQVGGDFFDVFSFWDDYVALVVGDATGKGLDAAATTNEVKYALRAYLHDARSPGKAVTRLNRLLCDTHSNRISGENDVPSLSFLSIAVAVVNRNTGEGMCTVAGAESPLLLRADGTTQEASQPGAMLGASPESQYDEGGFTLGSGDLIAVTTDGITEARRGSREFFGYEGFIRVLRDAFMEKTIPLDDIATRVVTSAKEFAGGKLKDDVCLLLARRD
ncbi:MAG: SpoIIE family protein phosphatase [Fibrella sp.]|nr:SpoIIE family protein phosphatase [Armatimonadota bacterium]